MEVPEQDLKSQWHKNLHERTTLLEQGLKQIELLLQIAKKTQEKNTAILKAYQDLQKEVPQELRAPILKKIQSAHQEQSAQEDSRFTIRVKQAQAIDKILERLKEPLPKYEMKNGYEKDLWGAYLKRQQEFIKWIPEYQKALKAISLTEQARLAIPIFQKALSDKN